MRLLNTTTLTLAEFWDHDDTPGYAILSHTWEKQEVSFQAIADLGSAAQLTGFSKIKACCEQAKEDGWKWAWIDTCCIDKTSSTELSEAINSMFRWYEESAICYAYLADVPSDDDLEAAKSAFSGSRWFKRGWTLQELIAPTEVEFFSMDWKRLGCRSNLSSQISEITRIGSDVLRNNKQALRRSIAQRMSWASRRTTTRLEDMAYCLMGLFDVNMPLLYGEGTKAFIRLQEEILKNSNDQSIFAWTAPRPDGIDKAKTLAGGFLATSHHYVPRHLSTQLIRRTQPYSMTNIGLRIEIPLCKVPGNGDKFMTVLLCGSTNNRDKHAFIGIPIFMNDSDSFQNRGGLLGLLGSKNIPESRLATRDAYQGPTALTVRSFGSDISGPRAKIDWDARNRSIKAYVGTLYIVQNPAYLGQQAPRIRDS
jgi:Heterokaryon incompatibility protein (HET)